MKRRSSRALGRNTLVSAVIGALAASSAQAITINLVFNSAASSNPAGDPTGANLTTIMNHVASVYEDIFEDSHTITLTYWYENLTAGTLAAHSLTSQAGGRETAGNIRFDPDASGNNWFFDTTPASNSEFTMGQTLWRDLSGGQQTSFYNAGANIPDTFEAAYTGTDNGSNANVTGNTDLLSVAFHETGHSLGMSASNNTTITETGDGDYDYDSVNVFGRSLATINASGGNIAHLASSFALMTPAIGTGIRRLPSHTDLLAMAAVHNYAALDIPRREWYAGASGWNTDANWVGNTIPGSADEVFVRNNGIGGTITATLSANGFAGTLSVSEASNVSTGAFLLAVTNVTTIDGLDTDILVQTGGELQSPTVTVQNQSQLFMNGGLVDSNTVNNSAEIVGQGTIDIATGLNNGGSITVGNGGNLTLTNATSSSVFNLDGPVGFSISEPGVVNVTGGNLTVVGGLTDAFNGTMNVSNSRVLSISQPWTIGGSSGTIIFTSDGVLNLNGGTTSATAAQVTGGAITVDGDINVTAHGTITPDITFNSGATVVVNSGGTFELNGNGTFNGGSYTGAGRLILDGANYTVAADTTIAVASLDWDGFSPVGTFTVNNGVTATINSTSITDAYSGTLNVLGTLAVNPTTPWSIDTGTLLLNSGTLSGTAVAISGDVSATNGTSQISNDATFTSLSSISIASGSTLNLSGDVSFGGGIITGAGTLRFDGNQTFTASTTVGVTTLDMDGFTPYGTMTVNSGVTATINSSVIEPGAGAFNGNAVVNSATLAINTSSGWASSGNIQLNDIGAGPARLTGSDLTNNSGGQITFSGGTFGGNGGRLEVPLINSGALTVAAGSHGIVTGTTTFSSTTNVTVNAGGNLQLGGATTYNGGTYTGPGTLSQEANATIAANTTLDVDTYDWDGGDLGPFANTTVNSGVILTINASAIDDDGVNDPHESTVTLNSGTVIVNTTNPWRKAGTLNFNNAGGGTPTLAGQTVFLQGGQFNSSGASQVTAGLRVNSGGVINTVTGTLTQNGTFTIQAGVTLTKTGNGTFLVNNTQGHGTGFLAVNQGTVQLNTDAGPVSGNLTINDAAALILNSTQHVSALNIASAGAARLTSGGSKVLVTRSLTVAGGPPPTGVLDLTDNDMIVDYTGATPYTTIRGYIKAGYNAGNWLGNGVRSSTAAGLTSTGLGYAEASLLGLVSFSGQPVDATSILVKYTYYGDATLDGQVDISDLGLLATSWQTAGDWSQGDFDYSSFIDISDLGKLATNWQLGVGSPLGPSFDEALAAVGLAGVSVPEPTMLLFSSALAGLLSHRGRRHARHSALAGFLASPAESPSPIQSAARSQIQTTPAQRDRDA